MEILVDAIKLQAEVVKYTEPQPVRLPDASINMPTMFAPEFILKTTPPRTSRAALMRASHHRIWSEVQERTAIMVIAPAGFGKTTLLSQWRQQWLKQGAIVPWLSVDVQDEPARFAIGLLHALRTASGRGSFDALMAEQAGQDEYAIDALTQLLAKVAHTGTKTVLVVDDAERLPRVTVEHSLQYLLHNAPPNLHVVIGSRMPLPLQTWELAAKGNFASVGIEDLRLTLDESIVVLGKRFGRRLSVDERARVHDITHGWPLGLQLVAAAIERESDLVTAIDSLSARHGDIERYFLEALVSRLPAPLMDFLIRVAILDHLSVELCDAVTGETCAEEYLAHLMADTPIVSVAELNGWLCLHPLARDFLRSRFEQLPASEQQALHTRASAWFAERERFHEAACHALAAGDTALAESYAVRSLWTLVTQGQLLEAREWLDRIPAETVAADIDLQLAAAWIQALGDSKAGSMRFLRSVLTDPRMSPRRRFVAARAAFTAAVYSDRPGLMPDILTEWLKGQSLPIDDPVWAVAYGNAQAGIALYAGQTQRVRELVGCLPYGIDKDAMRLPVAHAMTLVGLSLLCDNDVLQVEAVLEAPLGIAERIAGRRSMVAALYAPMLAAALLARNRPEAADAMLANRLDVIERTGAPDTVLLAYRTLAYVALGEGDERRALIVLDGLAAYAKSRSLPRLMMHSIAERVRIFALRSCHETVDRLLRELDRLADVFDRPEYLPFKALYECVTALAKVYASLARHDLDSADRYLAKADAAALHTHRVRDTLTVIALRAIVSRQRNAGNALALLVEAQNLAAIGGDERLLVDAHPMAAQMAMELSPMARGTRGGAPPYATVPQLDVPPRDRAASVRSGLLTIKETEILSLLDKGMSNKLIARAMSVSDETVKWHIKNIFLKLAAGTRKHAVDRARLLGLLPL